MACYRQKLTVWPGKLILSKKNSKTSKIMDKSSDWLTLEGAGGQDIHNFFNRSDFLDFVRFSECLFFFSRFDGSSVLMCVATIKVCQVKARTAPYFRDYNLYKSQYHSWFPRYGCDQSYNDRSNRAQHEKRVHGITSKRSQEASKEAIWDSTDLL